MNVLAGITKTSITLPREFVATYGLEQHTITTTNNDTNNNDTSLNTDSDTWSIVRYANHKSTSKAAAIYHHDIVNNLCHALPFLPSRWSPHERLPSTSDVAASWHVAYALEFVIYHPPITLDTKRYLREKAARSRDLQRQHQQFIRQLPARASYQHLRPDGAYSGSFLVSKWHVMTFARRFDEQFAKLGYKRFGAWAPYSFASLPADG